MTHEDMIEFIISEIKQILAEENIEVGDLGKDTPIFGENALLDSLGLVTLIVKIEEHIMESVGVALQIVDEEVVFSSGENPLRTSSSLATLVIEKLNAK